MQIKFRTYLSQSGHAPKIFEHRRTKEIQPIRPEEQAHDWREVANPDLVYHATLWPESPNVTGTLEITSDRPIKLGPSVTVEV